MINVGLDSTNSIVSQEIQRILMTAFDQSVKEAMKSCHLTQHLSEAYSLSGFKYDFIAGGSDDLSYGLSILPALLVVIQHLFASSLTADQLVSEREAGLLLRQAANGISIYFSLLSQVLMHFMVVIPQVISRKSDSTTFEVQLF